MVRPSIAGASVPSGKVRIRVRFVAPQAYVGIPYYRLRRLESKGLVAVGGGYFSGSATTAPADRASTGVTGYQRLRVRRIIPRPTGFDVWA